MGLTEKDYQLIDDLITDRLNESAYTSLKERVAQDPEFADELRRKIDLTKAIEASHHELKAEFGSMLGNSMKRKNSKRVLLRIAATVTLLLIATLFLWQASPSKNERVFAAYFKQYPIPANLRGENVETNLNEGFMAYETQNFSKALPIFNNSDDNSVSIKMYIGNCYLGIDRPEKAAEVFSSLDSEEAQWYLALTYVKMNQINEAREVLEALEIKSEIYRAKAKELLVDLAP
ncbi:MAG: tetratricopeptide repeat protein [Bacteroidota bacterium]